MPEPGKPLPGRRLTQMAQQAIAESLAEGDLAIDATMGNGHDTAFLADMVGDTGRVLALDIQQQAIDATRERLQVLGLLPRADLLLASHAQLPGLLPDNWRGRVAACMFNLGYLPGSDKHTVTRAESTGQALATLPALMRAGGRVSVLVYRGHAGGAEEFALLERLAEQEAGLRLLLRSDQAQTIPGHHPVLFVFETP